MWVLCMAALAIISITHWGYRWRNPKCHGKLPPGSMGLPLLGETLQFFTANTSSDIPPFIKKRMEKYGPIFRTNLVGRPIIISTDPDLNYFVFQQEGNLFQSWYPDTFTEIFGKQNVSSLHGVMYKYLKNMVLHLFGPESLKKMIPEVEQAALSRLQQWSCQDFTELKDATASMIFDLTAKKLISYDSSKSSENLRDNFVAFIQGLISFPLDIPGTAYHKCLQVNERAIGMLKDMLRERRGKSRDQPNDFFDYVIEKLEKEGTILTEEISLDLMFVLLFASFETTSIAMTLAIKFLSDHPLVLKQLTEEHEMILKQRKNADPGLTWKEYKSMTFTFQFINETEINFKGYTIPADGRERKQIAHPKISWLLAADRDCVGADFAKVEMAVFLHCLVTKYRWEAITGGNIVRTPGLQFPKGFHIRILEKDNRKQPIIPDT
ncbi:hypothetical protein L3X38_028231 [Prunus dulcis]|uniref:Cytochrome P450, family 87, subfamily A, polypeptide 2 n=1 Tax=Prunus dulcis TaxID=3755 RepID=A0AAD4VQZ1_PRUDU|nr:hypothetical protein L3X38_028231 [Prunus dulcis]